MPETGNYDSQTEAAVRSFQAERGLTADGIAGPRTTRAMVDAVNHWPPPPEPGAPVVIRSPDVKVVRYLQVQVLPCIADLVGNGYSGVTATTACEALAASNNPTPADAVDDAAWGELARSKEYRGLIHLPAHEITCRDGQVDHVDSPQGFTVSPGWTPTSLPIIGRAYEKAEWYEGPGHRIGGLATAPRVDDIGGGHDFHPPAPTVTRAPDGASVLISVRAASRVGAPIRIIQYQLLRHDAPFIWAALHVRLGCDGTRLATVTYSDIPSVRVYLDGSLSHSGEQSGRLAGFIADGGFILNLQGHGNLDPVCRTAVLLGPPPEIPTRDHCRRGIDDGLLGGS
jgi:hypothetical protein